MATIENIMSGARSYLRDFPQYFTASTEFSEYEPIIQLPHKNVVPHELTVTVVTAAGAFQGKLKSDPSVVPTVDTFTYTVDSREGLVKLLEAPTPDGWGSAQGVNIGGYYFQWIAPADLRFSTEVVLAEHADDNPDFRVDTLSDAHADVVCLGAAIECCWSLMFEFSRDIDISTPEAIGLPLTQRFRQVEDLLVMLLDKYKTKANLLGVGLERIKVGQLRRQSYTTNRYVPVYKPREWDDASFPVRLFPPIDQTDPSTPPEGFTPARAITGYYEEIKPYTDVSE